MILQKKDVVIYVQSEYNESFSYFHPAWKHSWDTPYGQQSKEEMTCELGRGDSSQPVWPNSGNPQPQYSPFEIRWPIPASELQINPKLVQNEGYN